MKKRILFVDDEPNILQGLKRMLRSQRNEWDMEFVDGGEAALEVMEKEHYDAIVTDMRMPGMDGAQLLEEVKKRHPESVRFVLSGHSDQELVMRSIGPSHQYLSKPCDPEVLKSTLEDTFALHDYLGSKSLRSFVAGLSSLPSMPEIYRQIVEALQSDTLSITEFGNLIEQDIGMTAKVLQLVNSSYFGLGRQITSPAEAANLLGLDVLKGLLLADGIFSQFDEKLVEKMSLQWHNSHSMAIATAAKNIAKAEGLSAVGIDQAFLGGLLHDMGSLVMAINKSDKYLETIEMCKESDLKMIETEQQMFDTTHAEIGAYMLGLWGIDEVVVTAVAYHHKPWDFPSKKFTPLTAVYVASTFIPENPMMSGVNSFEDDDLSYIESMGFADRLSVWQPLCEPVDDEAA